MNMKRFNTLLILTMIFSALLMAQSPILMTVGNKQVSQSEFEYLFFKNNFNGVSSPKSVDEYLELYTKFKLKVVDAESLGYDTVTSFKREYNSYRNQLAVGYMFDNELEDSLLKEAYQHLQEDLELHNILILFPKNPTPADTLKAYRKAWEAYGKLAKQSFDKVAKLYSDDSSAKKNGGKIGWVTGQMTTYAVERAMYNLPVGKYLEPIRTDYGYHIIKVSARRPAVGRIQVAHILKSFPEGATSADKTRVKDEINNIYRQLLEGVDFEMLASQNSDDKATANTGGVLPPFGLGTMVEEFEQAAFALEKVGELSKPVMTSYGWHIIKLERWVPQESFEKIKGQLLQAFQRDGRAEFARSEFVGRLKKGYGFSVNQTAYNEVARYIATHDSIDENVDFSLTILTIGKKNIPQKQFLQNVYNNLNKGEKPSAIRLKKLFDQFAENRVLEYEDLQLENKYPEFASLLREYREGILLFNISNDKVWEKSSKDDEGLKQFFELNKAKYTWDIPHYKGRIIFCKDKNIAKKIQKQLKKMPEEQVGGYLASFNLDSAMVDQQRGLWAKGENQVIDRLGFKDKKVKFTPTEKYPYVFVVGKMIGTEPDSYQDVRGELITDYQTYLEAQWLQELQKKYKVVVDQKVLNAIKEKVTRNKPNGR